MNRADDLKKGERGAWVSIIAYLILAFAKIFISYVGQSHALRADGLNNATDVIASVAVLIGLRISRRPPDEDHHYGHYRAETIASLFAGFVMAAVGLQVIVNTVQKLFVSGHTQPSMLATWVALGGAITMYAVYRFNLNLSRKVDSTSLHAAAQDNRSDALVSIGAFLGITGAQFGIFWLDPLTGLIVGLIICKTAWDIFSDSAHALTDGFDEQLIREIEESIAQVSDVKKVEDVKGRIHGNMPLIDITILVDPEMNVKKSHDITMRVEQLLEDKHGVSHAHIHIEPFEKKPKT
ncbi:putative transporter YdbO [Lentibacillus sp. JNUCC-1]|uniref:cation diffusion facilitator family transporter n=1 Tax=Lentibacillus sp. JNUCC-1 TaxID=2654513 RepID=UPI0012E7501F|nr:cation diffusion facilitator family transporter [Lentibacillus sp. JNUCC-1]MUV36640.1 putative transporter YdbO [Lentibacillus sp. JNUCC-1]